jgi:hypothetical protein
MKKIDTILTHLKTNPIFKKLDTQSSLRKLTKLLPLNISRGIKFAYIKNDILHFVLTHPVYKMELKYNQDLIKTLLNKLNIQDIQDIKYFVTSNQKVEFAKYTPPKYIEKSYGIFENHMKNEKLFEIVEDIRKNIKP